MQTYRTYIMYVLYAHTHARTLWSILCNILRYGEGSSLDLDVFCKQSTLQHEIPDNHRLIARHSLYFTHTRTHTHTQRYIHLDTSNWTHPPCHTHLSHDDGCSGRRHILHLNWVESSRYLDDGGFTEVGGEQPKGESERELRMCE